VTSKSRRIAGLLSLRLLNLFSYCLAIDIASLLCSNSNISNHNDFIHVAGISNSVGLVGSKTREAVMF